MRFCPTCKTWKPKSRDYFPYVHGQPNSRCKLCVNGGRKENYEASNSEYAKIRRLNKKLASEGLRKCGNCGEIKKKTIENFKYSKALDVWGLCRDCDPIMQKEQRLIRLRKMHGEDYPKKRTPKPKVIPESVKRNNLNIELEKQGLKNCCICDETKPLEMFQKDKKKKISKYKGACKACLSEKAKKHRASEKYKKRIASTEFKERNRQYSKKRYLKDKEKCMARSRVWANSPKGKIVRRIAASKRKAAKMNACPPWLSDSQYNEMKVIYLKAVTMEKKTGEKYHVDHVAPLQGENICGLHVPWNLEPITAAANLAKANHIDQERLDREQLELAVYACQHWHQMTIN